MNDTFKASQERFIGKMLDASIEDLHSNNSLFHSAEIESIVFELSKGEENVDLNVLKKNFWRNH